MPPLNPVTPEQAKRGNGEDKREGPQLKWEAPKELPNDLPPVEPLTEDMLPDPLRGWVMDIAGRMEVPPDFTAAGVVVGLSALLGRRIGIHPRQRDNWMVIPNLWGMDIGRPSLLKSPAFSEALRPLSRLVAQAQDVYNRALETYAIENEVYKARLEAAKNAIKTASRPHKPKQRGKVVELRVKDDIEAAVAQAKQEYEELRRSEPEPPTLRRYMTQDSTQEAVVEILSKNPTGILVARDELTGWLRAMDKLGYETARSFFIEAWSGDKPYSLDRIGRGYTHLEASCVSVFGGIQPGPLHNHVYQALTHGLGDDGLIQRFQIMVYPDAPASFKGVDRFPNGAAKDRAWDIYTAFDELDMSTIADRDQYSTIPALRFSLEAQEYFDEWYLHLVNDVLQKAPIPALESHFAKYRSLFPSLALILHLVDVVDGTAAGPVSLRAAQMAFKWCYYLESHARRVYASGVDPAAESAQALLTKIKAGALPNRFKVKQVRQKGWSKLTTTQEVHNAVELLEVFDCVQCVRSESPTGGRPSEDIWVNPGLIKNENA